MSFLPRRPEPPREPARGHREFAVEHDQHARTLADVDLDLAEARAELRAAAEALSRVRYVDARERLDVLLDERLAFGQAGGVR